MKDKADGPMVTVAREAIARSDLKHNRVQLYTARLFHPRNGQGPDVANDSGAAQGSRRWTPRRRSRTPLRSASMSTRQLMAYGNGPDWIEVRVELHQRFALPVACIVLAMVGIPLGIATRKGGKSAGYVIALFLGFFCYYLASLFR